MLLEGMKIVAIDDTASIRTFLRLSLEDEGAQFYGAANAKEGLALCEKIIPDLVVLDLGLPDRDGLDILSEIKNLHANHKPIILVLTVRKGHQVISEAKRKGADGYLSKPFMVEDLLQLIKKTLH